MLHAEELGGVEFFAQASFLVLFPLEGGASYSVRHDEQTSDFLRSNESKAPSMQGQRGHGSSC
jgi:hypothetical protein